MKNIELKRGLVPEQHSVTKTRIETIRSGNSEAGRGTQRLRTSISANVVRPQCRSTSYISCRCHRGRDHCGRSWHRLAQAWELRLVRDRFDTATVVAGDAAAVRSRVL